MRRRRLLILLGVLVCLVPALFLFAYLVMFVSVAVGAGKTYVVPSSAMEPTLHCARPGNGCLAGSDDRVFVCRICYSIGAPARGDIVAFKTPPAAAAVCGSSGTFLKRLIGIPGDTVFEDAQGNISVNGVPLDEPYVSAASRKQDVTRNRSYRKHTWDVLTGEYFFLGDNRATSCDSRAWGGVPRADLIGKAIATYWPPSRISLG